jgi:hypothetical protein
MGVWLAKRRQVGLAVAERLSVDRRGPDAAHDAARARCLGLPGALLGELVQELGKLLTRHDLLAAVLGKLLKRGADLLADGGVRRHVVGKLMERCGDLLLLCGELLRLAELLAKTLLAHEVARGIEAGAVALPELAWSELAWSELALSELAEGRIAKAGVAELRGNSLHASVAAHSGRPEHGRRQRLSEVRSIVSVRHDILHKLPPNECAVRTA